MTDQNQQYPPPQPPQGYPRPASQYPPPAPPQKKKKTPVIIIIVVVVVLLCLCGAIASLFTNSSDGAANNTPTPPAQTTPQPSSPSTPDPEESPTPEPEPELDPRNLPIGTTYEVQDGLFISVDSVETGWHSYDDKPAIQVTVSYANSSNREYSFNPYDWQAQTVGGVRNDTAFMVDGSTDEMSSGNLAPGGSFTKHLYFLEEDGIAKLVYGNSFWSNEQDYILWSVGQ
jgi:hypothetical protein